ncbi:subtilisin [Paracoccus sp. Z330]|uniref:Subtilisin n=1 Tax=Paracoccus onchidii TaxID=3017813 RepID=A0ABT4ZA84_9RHOB|nr:subtilisin [Paracoccus onchidii]MDB6176260.1 subtilisin [Paracoccus onchidii]
MIRVGVIDSGGPLTDHANDGHGHVAFGPDGCQTTVTPDRLGHGTAVAGIIRRACPPVQIRHAQVFDERPVTSALRVAAALDWLQGLPEADRPHLVCLSLGLRADRAVLREACARLTANGMVLVAAHPAQGEACFPAAYPRVLAATGDARCGWDDLSMPRPDVIGAWCNSPEHGQVGMGGASIGAARIVGHLAVMMARQGTLAPVQAFRALADRCLILGPERRKLAHG